MVNKYGLKTGHPTTRTFQNTKCITGSFNNNTAYSDTTPEHLQSLRKAWTTSLTEKPTKQKIQTQFTVTFKSNPLFVMIGVLFPSRRSLQVGFPQDSFTRIHFCVYMGDIPSTEYVSNVTTAAYADATSVGVRSCSLNTW